MLEVPRVLMEQRITFLPNGTAKNSADFHADLARLTAFSNHVGYMSKNRSRKDLQLKKGN
jgi:hypothetical protein